MRLRTALALIAVIFITGVGAYLAWRSTQRAMRAAVASVTERKEQIVDLGTLVTQVRELSRLETASMKVIHVSTISQSYDLVPNALAGDELTFLAAGDVIAGVDLSLLQPKDAWRDTDGTIVMRLPPPQILITRVDNRESKVVTRKTGMLRRSDINLETRARQNAETGIRTEALKKGILPLAAKNAESKLAQFLHTAGIQKVRFESSSFAKPTE